MKNSLLNFKINGDSRGSLVALENNKEIPFDVKRVYYIFDTTSGVKRGFHAHKNLEQVLVCVKGSCNIVLDDSVSRTEVCLDSPTKGLFIKSMIWREMYNFSNDCVLMVLASDHYKKNDYISDYKIFKELCLKDD